MVRTCQNVLLKPLPSFRNWLIWCLLEVRNPTTKSIGFARWEELQEERLGTSVPSIHNSLVSIKPLLRSPQERERKQTEPDSILWYTLDNKSTVELLELLEMSAGILIGLATEWVGLHHHNETHLDLKIFPSIVNLRPGVDMVSRRTNHGVSSGP